MQFIQYLAILKGLEMVFLAAIVAELAVADFGKQFGDFIGAIGVAQKLGLEVLPKRINIDAESIGVAINTDLESIRGGTFALRRQIAGLHGHRRIFFRGDRKPDAAGRLVHRAFDRILRVARFANAQTAIGIAKPIGKIVRADDVVGGEKRVGFGFLTEDGDFGVDVFPHNIGGDIDGAVGIETLEIKPSGNIAGVAAIILALAEFSKHKSSVQIAVGCHFRDEFVRLVGVLSDNINTAQAEKEVVVGLGIVPIKLDGSFPKHCVALGGGIGIGFIEVDAGHAEKARKELFLDERRGDKGDLVAWRYWRWHRDFLALVRFYGRVLYHIQVRGSRGNVKNWRGGIALRAEIWYNIRQ